jgi:hypothetical protein
MINGHRESGGQMGVFERIDLFDKLSDLELVSSTQLSARLSGLLTVVCTVLFLLQGITFARPGIHRCHLG